jgi:FkbM family methyltransferase
MIMPQQRTQLFDLTRKLLITLTGNGSDRGAWVNNLHHKLSYRLHKQLPKFGITGEVKIEIPGLPGHTLRMIAEDGGVAHQFLVYGSYETYESHLVDKFVKRGMTVYNVGGNIGYYAVRAGIAAGGEGRVYAFEPSTENFRLLQQNIEDNNLKHVRAINTAVADHTGMLRLYLSNTNSGDHQVFPAVEERAFIEIPSVSLDEFVKEEPAPDVIIMDVQGAEYSVLKGFGSYLSAPNRKPLILFMEFSPAHLRRAGHSPEELLNLIHQANLNVHVIDERRRTTLPISDEELIRITVGTEEKNLLCAERGVSV